MKRIEISKILEYKRKDENYIHAFKIAYRFKNDKSLWEWLIQKHL